MNDIEKEKKLNKIYKIGSIINITIFFLLLIIATIIGDKTDWTIRAISVVFFVMVQLVLHRWRPG